MRPTPAGIPEGFSRPKTTSAVYGMIIAVRFWTGYGCRMADDLSAEEFSTWIPLRQALEFLQQSMTKEQAIQTLVTCLWNDVLQSAAANCVVISKDSIVSKSELFLISFSVWGVVSTKEDNLLWVSNNLSLVTGIGQIHEEKGYLSYFGIRINSDQLNAMFNIPKPAVAGEANANKGGRPTALFWEDLLIDMARQLYDGDLKPNKQRDIEDAMLQWASNHDHSLSESAARERARKLFRAIQEKGKN